MENMDVRDRIIAELTKENRELKAQVALLTSTVEELQETIKELRRRLNQDSHNSSRPPSSDGYKKVRRASEQKRSGKKVGGQKGHPGTHMEIPHEPDEIKQHIPEKCKVCPHLTECLASENVFTCREKRYEVNAVITTKVTEHQSMEACACRLGEQNLRGEFPAGIRAYVQYGDSVTVLSGLLSTYGAVSVERIHVFLGSILGVSLSSGTILSMISKCAEKVGGTLKEIQKLLIGSEVVHFDETGAKINGKTVWVHNASTAQLTYQTVSKNRGQAGMDEGGILPNFSGTGVHDCWASYWKYEGVSHAVCNAHILRELTAVEEYSPGHQWASSFKALLCSMKKTKEAAIANGKKQLSYYFRRKFATQYDQILSLADKECPLPSDAPSGKPGKKKKGKERALIERLLKFKDSVCLFVHDFSVPFDNNQAERDVRNVKTKGKVSGCFRSDHGAQNYLNVMSYLSTGKKHGINVFEALTAAFSGNANIVLQ